jgi:hypothetical protein
VISGKESDSGEVRTDFFRFTFMAVPHADDAPRGAAWRSCEHNESSVQLTGGDEARLTIVLAVVGASKMRAGEDLFGAEQV